MNSIRQWDASHAVNENDALLSVSWSQASFAESCCHCQSMGDPCRLTEMQSCFHVEIFPERFKACNHIHRGNHQRRGIPPPRPSSSRLHVQWRALALFNWLRAMWFMMTFLQHWVRGKRNWVRNICFISAHNLSFHTRSKLDAFFNAPARSTSTSYFLLAYL